MSRSEAAEKKRKRERALALANAARFDLVKQLKRMVKALKIQLEERDVRIRRLVVRTRHCLNARR
jgi:hypothetical protein